MFGNERLGFRRPGEPVGIVVAVEALGTAPDRGLLLGRVLPMRAESPDRSLDHPDESAVVAGTHMLERRRCSCQEQERKQRLEQADEKAGRDHEGRCSDYGYEHGHKAPGLRLKQVEVV
jgi:hypothetical protein